MRSYRSIISTMIPKEAELDPDAQAFLTATTITDVTITNAINTLVIGLKAQSIWNKIYWLHPYVGGTATSHRFNLKNPLDSDSAFRLNFIGGWTHTSTGALPNGTNAYADTFVAPNSYMNNTDLSSFGYYSRSNTAYTSEYVMGSNSGPTNAACALIVRRDTNLRSGISDFSTGTSFRAAQDNNSLDGRGFFTVSQQGNAIKLYRNGILVVSNTVTTVNGALGSLPVVIGAIQALSGETPVIFGYTNKECALDYAAQKLNDTEMLNLNNLIQQFQTTLNRNV